MKRLLRLTCLLSLPLAAMPPPPPHGDNLLDSLTESIEKALHAWDLDEARLLMLQVEQLNLHGLALLHYVQGRMAFQLGLYEEAATEFVLAGQEDVPNSFLRLAKTAQRFLKTTQRFESAHFVLFLPEGKHAALAAYALDTLESQYEAIRVELGFAPREKLRVEMANTAYVSAGLAGVPLEKWLNSNMTGFCAFGKMVVLSPNIHGNFEWQNNLAREYVRFAVIRQTRGRAPPWLEEALASYLQTRWNRPPPPPLPQVDWTALQKHIRASRTLLLEKPSPPASQLALAEGFLFAEYLKNQLGPNAFPLLLQKLSLHGDAGRAIAELSGVSWTKWKQTLRNRVLSRHFPRGPPSPSSGKNPPGPRLLHALRLAKLYASQQHYEAAAHHYAKAWALGGQGQVSAAQAYVQVLLALSRFEEAERVLAISLEASAPASVWLSLGKLRLFQSQWAKAQQAFERALAQNPFSPEVHLGLYVAAQAQNNPPLAQRAKEAAAILLQTSPEAIVDMAHTFSSPEEMRGVPSGRGSVAN